MKILLPDNERAAAKRLEGLKQRFQRDPVFAERYTATMEDYFAKGHARELTSEESATVTPKTWYLPHHGVQNVNKPGKVRVVFDAAAAHRGKSLNTELMQGPDLCNSLLGVLFRFRLHKVALVADIKGMFQQFKVPQEDCDALRFLWWKKGLYDEAPVTCQMLRHIFGATDSPSVCTYGLRRCAEDNAKDFSPVTMETIFRSFYVDDNLKSIHTVPQAIELATNMTKMLGKGGLTLTKFQSNSEEVMAAIPKEDHAPEMKNFDPENATGSWSLMGHKIRYLWNNNQRAEPSDHQKGMLVSSRLSL
jgi:hypothetical protein